MSEKAPTPQLVSVSNVKQDQESIIDGFSGLLQNRYFWLVMVFLIAVVIGVYYYFNYLKKTPIQEEVTNKNSPNQEELQALMLMQAQQQMQEALRQQQIQELQRQQQMHEIQRQQQIQDSSNHKIQKPKIKHPQLEEIDIPMIEEDNENVREQRLSKEEMELLKRQLESGSSSH